VGIYLTNIPKIPSEVCGLLSAEDAIVHALDSFASMIPGFKGNDPILVIPISKLAPHPNQQVPVPDNLGLRLANERLLPLCPL
jgi:hypothetical protein